VACAETGQIERARPFLTRAVAADHPALLLECARHALSEGRNDDARDALLRVSAVAPDLRAEAEAMLLEVDQAEPLVVQSLALEPPVVEPTLVEVLVVEPPVVEPPVVEMPVVEATEPTLVEEWHSQFEREPLTPAPPIERRPREEPPVEELWPREEPVKPDATPDPEAETIAALRAAAQNPALEFQASAQLGRLFLRLGRIGEAIESLTRASQAVTPAREQRLEVMYALADALERSGDGARALEVFADLDFDAASYRDVQDRMARLRRVLGEGGAT
jgi:tetratricopeptide (TPR) repeat protein